MKTEIVKIYNIMDQKIQKMYALFLIENKAKTEKWKSIMGYVVKIQLCNHYYYFFVNYKISKSYYKTHHFSGITHFTFL